LYLGGGSNTASKILIRTSEGYSSLSNWIGGVTQTVWIECGEGLGWKQFVIEKGVIKHIY
jgi:hypothetical protein